MKLIWSDDKFEREITFGKGLMGIKHNSKRPNKVIVYLDEFGNMEYIPMLMGYLTREVKGVLAYDAKQEITVEWSLYEK